jgi:hypothetical protein
LDFKKIKIKNYFCNIRQKKRFLIFQLQQILYSAAYKNILSIYAYFFLKKKTGILYADAHTDSFEQKPYTLEFWLGWHLALQTVVEKAQIKSLKDWYL